jgi:hypothetical protein
VREDRLALRGNGAQYAMVSIRLSKVLGRFERSPIGQLKVENLAGWDERSDFAREVRYSCKLLYETLNLETDRLPLARIHPVPNGLLVDSNPLNAFEDIKPLLIRITGFYYTISVEHSPFTAVKDARDGNIRVLLH